MIRQVKEKVAQEPNLARAAGSSEGSSKKCESPTESSGATRKSSTRVTAKLQQAGQSVQARTTVERMR